MEELPRCSATPAFCAALPNATAAAGGAMGDMYGGEHGGDAVGQWGSALLLHALHVRVTVAVLVAVLTALSLFSYSLFIVVTGVGNLALVVLLQVAFQCWFRPATKVALRRTQAVRATRALLSIK